MSQSPLILLGMGLLLSFDLSLGLSKLLLDAFLSWPASRTQEVEFHAASEFVNALT